MTYRYLISVPAQQAAGLLALVIALLVFAGAAAAAVTINNGNLQTATEDVPYQQQISASGSNLIYNMTVMDNTAAAVTWLTIQSNTGLITGTPPTGSATVSPFTVTVSVFDSSNPADNTSKVFQLNVGASGGGVNAPITGSGGCALSSPAETPFWLAALASLAIGGWLSLRRRAVR